MNAKQSKAVNEVIFNELDIAYGDLHFSEDKNGWFVTEAYPLSTSRIGVMALMIKTLSVKIRVGFDKNVGMGTEKMYLNYDFSYTHPSGGSNGHEVRRVIDLN